MIDTLAVAGLCGLPVEKLVTADLVERELYAKVAKRGGDLIVSLIKAQANHNASAVAQIFKRR